MEKLLQEKDETYVKDLFEKNLDKEVKLTLFIQTAGGNKVNKYNEQYLPYTEEIIKEIANLSDKVKLNVYLDNPEKEKEYGIVQVPALFIEGEKADKNIVYYGIPSGHEFSSLLEDIIDISRGTTDLPEAIKTKIKSITTPVEILVFVTPTCPYCPKAVRIAHKFAMENSLIKGIMVEANEFPEWSQEFSVYAVPKVVINKRVQFEGALPEEQFVESVYEAIGINLV